MSLNGINAGYAATAATAIEKVQKADKATASSKESAYKSEAGATYETTVSASSKQTKNAALVAQLKADSEKRSAQMQSLVTQMFKKQGIAIGTADDMWKVLASGKFTADADTIAQAKEDISEDGYWGVNQTSDRIFSFALALSNGDEKQMEKMVKAVEKGFSLATKSWGQVSVTEQGLFEDFVLKSKERMCGRAQLEIMRITEQLTQKFGKNADNLSTANKKRLKDITESGKPCARCGFADFTCTEGCKWGKNGALTRTI